MCRLSKVWFIYNYGTICHIIGTISMTILRFFVS